VIYMAAMTRPPRERLRENSVRIAGRMAGSMLANMSIRKWAQARADNCSQ